MEDKPLFISNLNSELFDKEIKIKGILKKRKGIKAMKVANGIKHYTTFNLSASNGIDFIEVIYFHNSPKELYDLDENEGNPIIIYGTYKYNEKGNEIHTYIESNKFDILEISPFNIDNLTSSDRTEYKVIEQIIH